jgi:hypothetical protein
MAVAVTDPPVVTEAVPTCPGMVEPSAAIPEATVPPVVVAPPIPGVMTTGFAKPGSVVVEGVITEPGGCAHGAACGTVMPTTRKIAVLHFIAPVPLVGSQPNEMA